MYDNWTRREFIALSATLGGAMAATQWLQPPPAQAAPLPKAPPVAKMRVKLTVNGVPKSLTLDPRTSLLDMLREQLRLPGTKKGCDHGQCGACTVLVNGRRINSCLSLAVMHDGDTVVTVEGLGRPGKLHPMQAAFLHHDGFQCGYCTPGQICSAVGVLGEIKAGIPSHVTADLNGAMSESDDEIRERMSGNLCRCAAYTHIVAAVREVAGA